MPDINIPSLNLSLLQAGGIAVGTGLAIYAAYASRSRTQRPHLPPGPPGYPIVGNMLQMPSKDPEITFTEWGIKYGM